MHGHSGSIGSLTFTTISALAHTSAAFGTSVAPTARYVSSANPDPIPAPCSTSTVCPSPTSDSSPAGTCATRCSAVLISLGTPTIMPSPSYVVRRYAVRVLVCHDVQRGVVPSCNAPYFPASGPSHTTVCLSGSKNCVATSEISSSVSPATAATTSSRLRYGSP